MGWNRNVDGRTGGDNEKLSLEDVKMNRAEGQAVLNLPGWQDQYNEKN